MSSNYHYPGKELALFEEARQWKRYLAEKIKPYISGTVLEVGAGISETTPYLLNSKVHSWLCLEPDPELYRIILQKTEDRPGLETRLGTLADLSATEMFDTIVYIDVLEHIEEDREEMQRAATHLRPGGHLIVLSPAYPFLYSAFDKAIGHHRRYTRSALRRLRPAELEEKKIFHLESAGLLLLLMNRFLIRKTYPSKFTVKFWDRVLVPLSRVSDQLFFHSIGKTIIGIWQKRSP